jgi:hypothetical protein
MTHQHETENYAKTLTAPLQVCCVMPPVERRHGDEYWYSLGSMTYDEACVKIDEIKAGLKRNKVFRVSEYIPAVNFDLDVKYLKFEWYANSLNFIFDSTIEDVEL